MFDVNDFRAEDSMIGDGEEKAFQYHPKWPKHYQYLLGIVDGSLQIGKKNSRVTITFCELGDEEVSGVE